MKAIINISVTQNITIAEARDKHNRLYSKVTLRISRSSRPTAPQAEIPINISTQINKLQEEINEIRSTTIAGLKSSINSLAQDLEESKSKIASFDKRFDSLVKAHSSKSEAAAATAASHAARFDQLDAVLSKLAGAILGPPALPPPITLSDVNLLAGACNLSPPLNRSSYSLISPLPGSTISSPDEPSFMDEY